MASISPREDPQPEAWYSFVRRSSHRDRRSHRRHSVNQASPEHIRISVVEWDALKNRESTFRDTNKAFEHKNEAMQRSIRNANEAFARENEALQSSIRESKAELFRLQAQTAQLAMDNAKLRTDYIDSVNRGEKHHRDAKQLRMKFETLRAEKEDVEAALVRLKRELERTKERQTRHDSYDGGDHQGWRRRLGELKHALDKWKRRFEDSDKKCDEYARRISHLETVLKDQEDTLDTYEKILKRHGHIYG